MLKRTFLFSAIAALTITANAQKIAVTKGQKLEAVSSTKMSMEVMGQTIENETTATSQVEVKDVNDKGFLFGNTIKRITLKSNAMGQDINFDSDKKEDMDGMVGQTMKDRIGKSDEVVVDKQGKVIEIKNEKGDGTDQPTGGGGMSDMMNMTNNLAKGQPYPMLMQLPSKSVKPGDSWTDSSGTVETFKSVTTYTLKQITSDEVIVSFTGTVAKNGTMEQQGMEIQIDLTGNVKGDASYDPASGFLKKSTTISDVKGTLGVMGQNAPMTMNMTVNTTTKKI